MLDQVLLALCNELSLYLYRSTAIHGMRAIPRGLGVKSGFVQRKILNSLLYIYLTPPDLKRAAAPSEPWTDLFEIRHGRTRLLLKPNPMTRTKGSRQAQWQEIFLPSKQTQALYLLQLFMLLFLFFVFFKTMYIIRVQVSQKSYSETIKQCKSWRVLVKGQGEKNGSCPFDSFQAT